jgi:hypothetical protein
MFKHFLPPYGQYLLYEVSLLIKLTNDQSVTRSLREEKEETMGTPNPSEDCCMAKLSISCVNYIT